MIRGLPPGYMVGGFEPKREQKRYPGEFKECPGCGGQMHHQAQLCQKCHTKQKTKGRNVSKERRERFDLALAAGWTLEDIYGYDPDEPYDPQKDKLPTRQEIVKRMIENWYKGGRSE